ncbi:glycosyltransferase family 9 protein [Flaviramulus aquimarinus]|uniref:Glycosyltransferase family 9 protein n=2 Tax=Flaviramulus aquimarinus TaxID=1170456 RepID=A0ABP9F9N5_9FLAO
MIGDVLTSSILFEALRQKFPDAQLDYLINTHTYPVVENNPFIDDFIFFTKKEETSKNAFFKLAKSVKHKNYDIVIDVYSKLSSNFISVVSQAKTRISYHKYYTTLFYNYNIKRQKSTDQKAGLAIANRMQLLSPLNIESKSIKPKIYLTKHEIANSKRFLEKYHIDLKKPLYMISVLGSGDNKTYPAPYMAKAIDIIAQQTQGQILFNYIPKQETQAKEIFNLCEDHTKTHIFFNVFGKSLRDFLAITYHCDALIGNEGGAVNMAKALDIKTFTIFSPWIDKATWGLFEDSNNISVHLKDFKPELYTKPEKKLKKETFALYHKFNPELFFDKLKSFLQN